MFSSKEDMPKGWRILVAGEEKEKKKHLSYVAVSVDLSPNRLRRANRESGAAYGSQPNCPSRAKSNAGNCCQTRSPAGCSDVGSAIFTAAAHAAKRHTESPLPGCRPGGLNLGAVSIGLKPGLIDGGGGALRWVRI